MHLPHDVILQSGIVYLSFKTTVDDIEWSDSRRVKEIYKRVDSYNFSASSDNGSWMTNKFDIIDGQFKAMVTQAGPSGQYVSQDFIRVTVKWKQQVI